MELTRRKILAVLPGIAFCFIGKKITASTQPALRPKPEAAAAKLVNLFKHKESAVAIGVAFLQSRLKEASVPDLIEKLFPNQPHPARWLIGSHTSAIRETLAGQIRRDFTRERIVNVGGWVLSATECRLCALATLL